MRDDEEDRDMAGMITWHELFTTDVERAIAFYTELLGAEIETASMGDFDYQMLNKDGRSHAGFVKDEQGVAPSHWYPYIHSDDVDVSVQAATAAGAQLIHGPTDIADMLRFAVLGDPQHATFGLITGEGNPPQGLFAWDELHAADLGAAESFYGTVAGWRTEDFMEGYRAWYSADAMVGGLMQKQGESAPTLWLPYLAVDDTDAATAQAQELGATVMLDPTTMDDVGRFSVVADPVGAAVGLHKSANA
jgi:hypothetical protein